MGRLFNRKKKPTDSEILATQKAIAEARKAQAESIKTAIDGINAKMSSWSFMDQEFYSTGIKQGPYAGIMQGNSNSIARRNSRKVYDQSPVAQSMVTTFATLTVGKGLGLEAQPMYDLIPDAKGWTDDQKRDWQTTTEHRYKLWAKRRTISYENNNNRYQQEQQIFHDLLIDGEYFELYRYSANTKRNPMTIQLIKPEDVRTPSGSTVASGNCEEDGIEYDARGAAVAYHIYDHKTDKTIRVLREGVRSGRTFVNHVKLGHNRRGVGILANIVTELMKLGDYELLEIQAAVVNALYALWVETPEGDDGMPTVSAGLGSASQTTEQSETSAEDWLRDRKNLDYSEGGLIVDALPGGYQIKSHDTKRPNVNFGMFMDQVKKNLASSRGLPVSVLDKQFQNNYSASRGELILAWYEIETYRFNHSMTNDLVYKMWLWGEVANSKIIAPGFTSDEDTRDAWCNAEWNGNQRPDIDPLKSVQAHMMEQNRGYRTGKKITAERNGGDYDENLRIVKGELEQVAENQVPFQPVDVNLEDQ